MPIVFSLVTNSFDLFQETIILFSFRARIVDKFGFLDVQLVKQIGAAPLGATFWASQHAERWENAKLSPTNTEEAQKDAIKKRVEHLERLLSHSKKSEKLRELSLNNPVETSFKSKYY